MSLKLLLAEALETLKQASRDEQGCDHLQLKLAESSKRRLELPNLRRKYAGVFDTRIRGLEMLNYVRVNSDDRQLIRFCADTMQAGMDACERVRDKETSILLPAAMVQGNFTVNSVTVVGDKGQRQVVDNITPTGNRSDGLLVTKDGYVRLGEPIFEIGGHNEVTLHGGKPVRHEWSLQDGAYQLSVVNNDSYAIAAPEIDVVIQSESPATGQRMLYRKKLPPGCAWSRFIGVVKTSVVRIAIASDAWMRDSKIRVELVRITNAKDAFGNPIAETPQEVDEAIAVGGAGGWNPHAAEAAAMAAVNAHNSNGGVDPYPRKGSHTSTATHSSSIATSATTYGNGNGYANADLNQVPTWLADAYVPTAYEGPSVVEPLGMPTMATMLTPMTIIGPAPPMAPLGAASAGVDTAASAAASSRHVTAASGDISGGLPLEISPINCSPQQRLQRIKQASWQWYEEPPQGFTAANFNSTETEANRELLAAISNLAEPTPLHDEE